jgi:cation diffusion facilitator CzcD-associated flavoprotein CzcO
MKRFQGPIVHPQKWPEDLRYDGKRVVVIGSGATAVTIVPAMAARAAHVVMLQRSPTYIVARPSEEAVAKRLGQWLPARITHAAVRWKNILLQMYLYRLSRRKPKAVRAQIIKLAQAEVGPQFNAADYFNPRYEPWDQRMCVVPDGDLFAAMRRGQASIVNGEIETFTETGLRLTSGQDIAADVIVTATGLKMRLMGGIAIEVDGAPVDVADTTAYKSAMFSGVPNLVSIFGYTNASWTLKSDLIAAYVCRLLSHMDRHGYAICTPRLGDVTIAEGPTLPLTSGYVERARHLLPKQGARKPWRIHQNYALDVMALRFGRVDDGALEFRRREPASRAAQPALS